MSWCFRVCDMLCVLRFLLTSMRLLSGYGKFRWKFENWTLKISKISWILSFKIPSLICSRSHAMLDGWPPSDHSVTKVIGTLLPEVKCFVRLVQTIIKLFQHNQKHVCSVSVSVADLRPSSELTSGFRRQQVNCPSGSVGSLLRLDSCCCSSWCILLLLWVFRSCLIPCQLSNHCPSPLK